MIYASCLSFSIYQMKMLNNTISKKMPSILRFCVSPHSPTDCFPKKSCKTLIFFFLQNPFSCSPSFHRNPNLLSLALRTHFRLVLNSPTWSFHTLHKPTVKLNSATHLLSNCAKLPSSLLVQNRNLSTLCYISGTHAMSL